MTEAHLRSESVWRQTCTATSRDDDNHLSRGAADDVCRGWGSGLGARGPACIMIGKGVNVLTPGRR